MPQCHITQARQEGKKTDACLCVVSQRYLISLEPAVSYTTPWQQLMEETQQPNLNHSL